MGRQPKKCPKKCIKHLFSLKPVHYSAFFSRESQFCYCPQNSKTQARIPIFNRDGKPYTAAFILAVDQLKLVNNDQIYQIEHERFKKQNHQQKTQILVPKPRSKSCYCSICKQIYEDYQDHVSSLKHKQTIKTCQFNNDILGLCKLFRNNIHKISRIIFPEELIKSIPSNSCYEITPDCKNQNQKKFYFQVEEVEFCFQKSTKQSLLEGPNKGKGLKSFHSYGQCFDAKIDDGFQNNFLQYSLMKQFNENRFLPHCGSFKAVQQTASPVKIRIQKPIILTGKSFTGDD